MSKLNVDKHISVEVELDELDLTSAESKATYAQIKEYILEKFGLKVSALYIAQIKKKCGIELRENYNKSKKEKQVITQCTPEKEGAIMDCIKVMFGCPIFIAFAFFYFNICVHINNIANAFFDGRGFNRRYFCNAFF